MSPLSPPSYTVETIQTPSYSAEPHLHETRLSQGHPTAPPPFPFSAGLAIATAQPPLPPSPSPPGAEFVKDSKRGSLRLRLAGQAHVHVALPVFNSCRPIEGTVDLLKPEGLAFVVVRVEGLLKVEEHAGRGTTTTVLCSETVTLWREGVDAWPCSSSFPFSITLPTTFGDDHGSWSLPPTYEAHLNGLPGFTASVEYSVTAIASKGKRIKLGIGVTTVSTPFVYYIRARPAKGIPPRLQSKTSSPGLHISPAWRMHENFIAARIPGSPVKDIICKFYTPASHILCMRQPIPYHIAFTGPPLALATLLTYLPSRTGAAPVRACTQIQVLRQTSVDVRNEHYLPVGATSEMWRMTSIGEGSLYRTGDGSDWLSFAGEVSVDLEVKTGGFRAAGLWVKDCIVFSISPPDPYKGPVGDMRCVIPIRLVTDPTRNPGAASDAIVLQESPTPSEAHGTVIAASDGEGAPYYTPHSSFASEYA